MTILREIMIRIVAIPLLALLVFSALIMVMLTFALGAAGSFCELVTSGVKPLLDPRRAPGRVDRITTVDQGESYASHDG